VKDIEISRLEMGDYVSQVLVPTEKVVCKDEEKLIKDKIIFSLGMS
jgi:transcriptional antiterminator NusG